MNFCVTVFKVLLIICIQCPSTEEFGYNLIFIHPRLSGKWFCSSTKISKMILVFILFLFPILQSIIWREKPYNHFFPHPFLVYLCTKNSLLSLFHYWSRAAAAGKGWAGPQVVRFWEKTVYSLSTHTLLLGNSQIFGTHPMCILYNIMVSFY